MFITKKHVIIPNYVKITSNPIKVVSSFKLQGVNIEKDLFFQRHIEALKSTIKRKLYYIKRLFISSNSIKIQFFKTFIQPHFDYCSSLLMYCTKAAIKRIEIFYNICLFRLTGMRLFNLTYLQKYQILKPLNL